MSRAVKLIVSMSRKNHAKRLIRFITQNVRGLKNDVKIHELITSLKDRQVNVYSLNFDSQVSLIFSKSFVNRTDDKKKNFRRLSNWVDSGGKRLGDM